MNPATFLRVLGPEPWNVAYAEPSIRPDDSRYGDNPNRVQRHTQFQVILKPDPGNPQELYLRSLEALGIDTKAHDIRFVEDNWESPVLGAWGLGWEVWLDGMEVTQFTYFQQAGGKPLHVPAVEITYGLERILMALQGVSHFKDILYAPGVSYGEMFLQNEYEMSVFNLDEANVEDQRHRFELFEAEARRLLDKRLPIPAYDHLLKLSHTFNVMDARGAVGVTERADCFATLRSLAREITALWLERREEQGFPLGTVDLLPSRLDTDAEELKKLRAQTSLPTEPADFVLELGSEELPPDDLDAALGYLKDRIPVLLDDLRLGHGGLVIEGTPRRLSILVHALAPRQSNTSEKRRGPPARAAYDGEGAPTKALLGFCKKNAVTVEDCFVEEDPKGTGYVWVEVKEEGRPAAVVLAEVLPQVLYDMKFRKSMRWQSDATYSRPLRWLVGMHGDAVVPMKFGGLLSGNSTRVLRNDVSPERTIDSAEDYVKILQDARIMLSSSDRKHLIWDEVQSEAHAIDGIIPDSCRGHLLSEVANLVESPTVIRGSFDESFLRLPREVLISVMMKHQRYFPVMAAAPSSDALLPHFITVANGSIDRDTVRQGNEAVLRARFEDAIFFYENDLKMKLAEYRPKLSGTAFQKELGSLLDKADRVESLVSALSKVMNLESCLNVAIPAAHLCKADLATSMVIEMTSLAGIMGRHYALQEGQPEAVAQAVFESVLPRHAGDELPTSRAGSLLSIADKLDSLVGLFAAGCAPTATTDMYGLRRAAVGLLQVLCSGDGLHIDLVSAIDAAAAVQPIAVGKDAREAVLEFIQRRLEQILVDDNVQVEAVRSALGERGRDPALAAATAREINEEMMKGEAGKLYQVMAAMARSIRLTRTKNIEDSWTVDPSLFENDEEKNLYETVTTMAERIYDNMPVTEFLNLAEDLIMPLDAYFEKVFVMCDDEARQKSRLALMRDVSHLSNGILDLTELPGF